ncbi:hypothetical protein JCM17844_09750 [Iodidimonas gelatinilytica]|uniref:Type 1 capsular polysaccharide biosynthesis protein J n=1 Tax=Iodidimonas gelatinilytica TaxID=1236966 RepID=A0A5A7MQV3_9PROT|nr:DUF6356 family protein [Iodidimonas gelatinilytica]GEQ97338.1 hypothetical protein JCM17844_09750 [Iodidimonas gelatinilytica]GEQ99662.1 hypothetical protein JCM17845_02860 [Iodidimonas gelatinilytica]
MFYRFFLEHPKSVGEGYFAHMASALSFAVLLLTGAGVCFVHAFLPGCFTKTGSAIVGRLHDKMIRSRRRRPQNAQCPDRPMASFDYVI